MPVKNDHEMLPMSDNGWARWGQHVLLELERQDKNICDLINKIEKVQTEQELLKLKSGIWGVIGASIPILLFIIGWLLKSVLIGP